MFPLIVLALVVELPLLAATLVLTRPQSIAAAVALGAWAVLGPLLRNPFKNLAQRLGEQATAPLANYYFTVLPLAMLLQWLAMPPGAWRRGLLAAVGGLGLAAVSRRVDRPAAVPAATGDRPPDDAVGAALTFVEHGQQADGGFSVVVGRDAELRGGEAARCIFETAFIARILGRWTDHPRAEQTLERARAFLAAEREPSGLWPYSAAAASSPRTRTPQPARCSSWGPARPTRRRSRRSSATATPTARSRRGSSTARPDRQHRNCAVPMRQSGRAVEGPRRDRGIGVRLPRIASIAAGGRRGPRRASRRLWSPRPRG